MPPLVKLHFFAAHDLNGDPVLEVDSDDDYFEGLEWSPNLGLGSLKVQFNRHWGYALLGSDAMRPEVFVRIIVPEVDETAYLWGGFILEKELKVIDKGERGVESYVFGGPGPKYLLHRAVLFPEKYSEGAWVVVDRGNWVWRWGETATAGRILNRILAEDAANPLSALGSFVTQSFDHLTDSNGTAWADDIAPGVGDFELPIGQNFLDNLYALEDASESLITMFGLGSEGAPEFRLDAYQSFGRDLTGAIGSGTVHFTEGVNINNELVVNGGAKHRASHAVVNGKDRTWAIAERPSWDPGEYVSHIAVDYERSSSEVILERAGIRWLRKQETNEQALELEIQPGFEDTAGLYFPGPEGTAGHFWPGDIVSLSTGTGPGDSPLDYNNADQLVTGLKVKLRKAAKSDTADHAALSWDVRVTLNKERDSGSGPGTQSQASGNQGGPGGCKCPPLCHVHIPGEEPSETVTPLFEFNAQDDGGDTLSWAGVLANQGPPGAAGTSHYYFTGGGGFDEMDRELIGAGVTMRISGWIKDVGAGEKLEVRFFDSLDGDISQEVLWDTVTGGTWNAFSKDVVTPVGTVKWALGRAGAISFDELRIGTVATDPGDGGQPGDIPSDVGDEGASGDNERAARCDHVHAHGNLSEDGNHYHDSSQIEGIGTSVAQPSISKVAEQFSSSSTTCVLTVTAPAAGETCLLVVASNSGRVPTSVSQTNVTWTQRYTNTGNNQVVTIFTGVASASAGTSITVSFGSSGTQQAAFWVSDTAAFTTGTGVATSTAASGTNTALTAAVTVGNYYIAAISATGAAAGSYYGMNQPSVPVTFAGGALRCIFLAASQSRLSHWNNQPTSTAYNSVLVGMT